MLLLQITEYTNKQNTHLRSSQDGHKIIAGMQPYGLYQRKYDSKAARHTLLNSAESKSSMRTPQNSRLCIVIWSRSKVDCHEPEHDGGMMVGSGILLSKGQLLKTPLKCTPAWLLQGLMKGYPLPVQAPRMEPMIHVVLCVCMYVHGSDSYRDARPNVLCLTP